MENSIFLPSYLFLAIESVTKVYRYVLNAFKDKSLKKNDVPVSQSQQKYAYKSSKALSSWVNDLIQRLNFFNTWAKMAYTAMHHRYVERLFLCFCVIFILNLMVSPCNFTSLASEFSLQHVNLNKRDVLFFFNLKNFRVFYLRCKCVNFSIF